MGTAQLAPAASASCLCGPFAAQAYARSPMASTSRRRLDAFLRTAVAPMLRDEGFTQSGHSWRRRLDDAIAVLAIHGNPWNGSQVRFSCVGGLWYPAVARRLRQRAQRRPQWWQCHVRWSEPGRDHTLGPVGADAALTRRVRAELRRLWRWLAPRTALAGAWRALPKPPRCPPGLPVANALRALAGHKPLAAPRRKRTPRSLAGTFAVLDVRPG